MPKFSCSQVSGFALVEAPLRFTLPSAKPYGYCTNCGEFTSKLKPVEDFDGRLTEDMLCPVCTEARAIYGLSQFAADELARCAHAARHPVRD